jgi:hypothetical protein
MFSSSSAGSLSIKLEHVVCGGDDGIAMIRNSSTDVDEYGRDGDHASGGTQ